MVTYKSNRWQCRSYNYFRNRVGRGIIKLHLVYRASTSGASHMEKLVYVYENGKLAAVSPKLRNSTQNAFNLQISRIDKP